MKFPITRESLQAFDPIQEKKERDEIIVKHHIDYLVQDIGNTIEQIMSWEIPAISKQGSNSRTKASIDKGEEEYNTMMTEKRYIYRGLDDIQNEKYSRRQIGVKKTILINRLVEKLKENFIGCNIILDPLNTYIIIDWS